MRFVALLVTLLYLCAATPAAAALAPVREVPAAREEFRCAHHDCACKTAERCRKSCCCLHSQRAASSRPKSARVTALAALECHGLPSPEQAMSSSMKPHLPPPDLAAAVPPAQSTQSAGALPAPRSSVPDEPDKVPI